MAKRILSFTLIAYASWLGMMAIHESGHALAGWLSGGHVQRIVLPLWGFSRTDVSTNPHPAIEVWAGPLCGSIVPLLVWLIVRKPWRSWRFFAGFCLIANGSYLGIGWLMRSGDAWELTKLGTPRWVLILVGSLGIVSGLWIWHRLGERRPPIPSAALWDRTM
jgi:hypothetical protein